MTKLFCGHVIPDVLYMAMFKAKNVFCPKCGLQWRGSMVISHDKTLPKKELHWAMENAPKKGRQR